MLHNEKNEQYNRENYAVTKFADQFTTFNYRFFHVTYPEPGPTFIFVHEFRHLMKENDDLYSPGSLGEVIAGNTDKSRYEQDADEFATNFPKQCTCEKK